MSEDRLFSILTYWKSEAYDLSDQLKYVRNLYEEEHLNLQKKLIEVENENISLKNSFEILSTIENEHLFNVSQSLISDQISSLSNNFLQTLVRLLSTTNIQQSTKKSSPQMIESIQINIKQIENLIQTINEDCFKQLQK